jgi:hypothetical protein
MPSSGYSSKQAKQIVTNKHGVSVQSCCLVAEARWAQPPLLRHRQRDTFDESAAPARNRFRMWSFETVRGVVLTTHPARTQAPDWGAPEMGPVEEVPLFVV